MSVKISLAHSLIHFNLSTTVMFYVVMLYIVFSMSNTSPVTGQREISKAQVLSES